MENTTLKIGDYEIKLRVARSHIDRAIGLIKTRYLPPDEGMLFVFPHENRWGITMAGMVFPIDIIWLNNNGMVVDIERGAKPLSGIWGSFKPPMRPIEKARYVLELCANQVEGRGIKIGQYLLPKEMMA
jgi:uncharacterized protein